MNFAGVFCAKFMSAPKSESQSRVYDITLGKRTMEKYRNILGQVQVRICANAALGIIGV